MTNKIFKEKLKALFEEKFGKLDNIPYAFIVLNGETPKIRIEYPGYDKSAQLSGEYDPKYLPGFRSYVKTVLFVNETNRTGFDRKGPFRWLGEKYRKDFDEKDVDEADKYEGDVFLFIANSVLSDDFIKKTTDKKIEELTTYAEYTVKQLDNWGYRPICNEIIPEINGCLPEQIYPHSTKHLETILKKLSENIIEYGRI